MQIACIAVAATVGALVMLGARRAGMAEMFAAAGYGLAPGAGRVIAALVGCAIHVVWIGVWSVLYATVARTYRGAGATIAAAVVASLAYVASLVAPTAAGPVSTVMSGERVLLHVVLALALAAGMRLARTR